MSYYNSQQPQQHHDPNAANSWNAAPGPGGGPAPPMGFYSAPAGAHSAPAGAQPASHSSAAAPRPAVFNPAAMAAAAAMAAGSGMDMNSLAGTMNVSDDVLKRVAEEAWKGGTARLDFASSYWDALRCYFAVDNRYVMAKAARVLFFGMGPAGTGGGWARGHTDVSPHTPPGALSPSPKSGSQTLPTNDGNAPDLYLPAMSLITFVLLAGLADGAKGSFEPDTLRLAFRNCALAWAAEVGMMKGATQAAGTPVAAADLAAYAGYKFLGMCVNMIVGLGFGKRGYYLALLWTASSAGYFTLKTLSHAVPKRSGIAPASGGVKREFVVLGAAVGQAVVMWGLGQTKHLS